MTESFISFCFMTLIAKRLFNEGFVRAVALYSRIRGEYGTSQAVRAVKNLPAGAGDVRDMASIPGESQGQRNLVGYSPWGLKKSDMTETTQHAHTSFRGSSLPGSRDNFQISLWMIRESNPSPGTWDVSTNQDKEVNYRANYRHPGK